MASRAATGRRVPGGDCRAGGEIRAEEAGRRREKGGIRPGKLLPVRRRCGFGGGRTHSKGAKAPLHSAGINVSQQPLKDVVTSIADDYGIPIQINTAALEEVAVQSDQPIDASYHNISLQSALHLMLKGLNLTYVIRDEVLLVTTVEDSEAHLKTCVYNVRSLVGDGDARIDGLIDTIHSCIATDTWAKNGGARLKSARSVPGCS